MRSSPVCHFARTLDRGKDKDSIYSRAYITFKTPEALVAFHRGYDGWTFKDKAGTSTAFLSGPSSAADPRLESQGTSTKLSSSSRPTRGCRPRLRKPIRGKARSTKASRLKSGFWLGWLTTNPTIADPDFLAFETALTAPPDPNDTPAEPGLFFLSFPTTRPSSFTDSRSLLCVVREQDPKSTPLIEHLRAQKAAALATRKAAAAANRKNKAAAKEGKEPKSGKKNAKDKKSGKGGKSKEASRSGTPVPPASASGSKSTASTRTASGSGTPRNSKARDPPGVVYPPGSVGAQQQQQQAAATASATSAKAQQAQLVRQQLQRQHQQQQASRGGGSNPAAAATTANPPGPAKPPPMILKRQPATTTTTSTGGQATPPASSSTPVPPSVLTKPPKGPKADVAGQKRQVGAAIGAALNDANGSGSRGGRGRGRGGARGGGTGARGSGGRGGRGRGGGGAGGTSSAPSGGGAPS